MSGDEFAMFVHQNGPRLLRFGILLCGHRKDAEDMLQDALVRAYPRWNRLRDQQPEAYIRRSMINRLTSRRRSPWNRRRFSDVPDTAAPVDEVGRADDREALLAALRGLPPRMRAIIVLRYWLGCTERETAAELACSTGAVKSQASRGIQRLRASFDIGLRVPDESGDPT